MKKETAQNFIVDIFKTSNYIVHPDYKLFVFLVDKDGRVLIVFRHDDNFVWCRHFGFWDILIKDYNLSDLMVRDIIATSLKFWMQKENIILEPFYSISDVLFEYDLKIKGII